ncbi:hypothetical protein BUALT_Bualt02G0078900 [Buddleja alternifolia]|uniref:Peptidase A1 domain-containing protein n=1 Tax=Buddleja alternifolia TaxID=168488 RepID=A0AAV6Y5E8_9LAMI|nr:hypothetical protein BUALT_Bualt02G0078900 [Buddleja alternifolia]
MENDESLSSSSSQLTGIVIITLPPSDNPCLGKTITAFTLSDDHHHFSTPPPLDQDQPRSSSTTPQNQTFSFFTTRSTTLLPILALSLIAFLYIWVSLSQETLFELRHEIGNDYDDDRNYKNKSQRTFLFPLYQKKPPYRDFELKLGRLVGFDAMMSRRKSKAKSMSTASKIDATSVQPVMGSVYPDGSVTCLLLPFPHPNGTVVLYYTYLHFGNPPRPYFLDVDTGSDLTWIQCDAPCTSCAKGAHPFYKPVKANIIPHRDTYCVEIQGNQGSNHCASCHQCDYEIEYADHSSSMGVLARDQLSLNIANGSSASSKVVFGCAYDQQGLLLNTLGKTDGILGLSRAKISVPSQLANQGIIKNVIGHCLANDASDGGYLFFGDDFVPHWQMAWVPMLQSHDLNSYLTKMVKMSYGSRQIGLGDSGNGQGRLVFDTGSSYSYFTEQAYNNLVTLLNDVSSESLVRDMSDASLPICWRAKIPVRSVKDVRQFFKPLNLQFGSKWWIFSTKLQIPPEGYLVTSGKGNVCLGILNGREVHDGSTFILGDISLRGLLVVYDNVKEKIGWVRSDCARPQRSETHVVY